MKESFALHQDTSHFNDLSLILFEKKNCFLRTLKNSVSIKMYPQDYKSSNLEYLVKTVKY